MHELWIEKDGDGQTFCLAGPLGEEARKLLGPDAKLVWTVEASSHFEAMTAYYQFMVGDNTQPIKLGTPSLIRKNGLMVKRAEQALGADSPVAGFFAKLRGRAAQAQR